jgi:hypothetical protein
MKPDRRNDLLPRDAALARLLEEALESKAAGDAHGSACPDAEILAAYAEHGLSDREASRWEGHIADCGRCQKIIAGVVAGGENLEEARNKEQESPVPAFVIRKPAPQRGARESSRWPGLWRWWVPGLGLATAAVLWFALHPALPHQGSPQPESRAAATTGTSQGGAPGNPAAASTKPEETQMAQAQAPPAPGEISGAAGTSRAAGGGTIRDSEELQANSAADALKKSAKQGSLQSNGQSEAQAPSATSAVSSAISGAPRAAASSPVPEVKEKDSEAAAAQTTDKKTQTIEALAGAASAGAAVARPAAPAAAPPAAEAGSEASQTQGVARQLDRSAGSADFSSSNQVRALAKTASSQIEFASPDRSALWRVGPGGLIERSSDRGQTWRAQASGVTADLLAGAAPSAKIAWAVGRGGIIVRTEDGERWQRAMPPSFVSAAGAQNVAPPDWISIEARDELHATIVSRDLHRYATADGGRTWVQQP